MKQTIGLLLVIRNEIKRIKECLDWYLPYVDEVAIADQQSTDGTWHELVSYQKRVMKERGNIFHIFRDTNHGYCEPSKQKTADLLKTDWILYVDPDEVFPVKFLEIMHKQVEDERYDGYRFPRYNVFHVQVFDENVPIEPKWLEIIHPKKDYQTKLTRRKASVFPTYLHNRVRVDRNGQKLIYDLPYVIRHIKTLQEQWEDNKRYREVNREKLVKNEAS